MTDDEKDDSLNDELYAEDDYDPDDDGFTIRDRLQAPTALQYTTRDLHTLIHEGIVDLNPPYQRGTPLLINALRNLVHRFHRRGMARRQTNQAD